MIIHGLIDVLERLKNSGEPLHDLENSDMAGYQRLFLFDKENIMSLPERRRSGKEGMDQSVDIAFCEKPGGGKPRERT